MALPITALLLLVVFVLGYAVDVILCIMVFIYSSMSFSSFSADKQSGWNTYASALPVSKKDLVLSKYILSFSTALAGALFALLVRLASGQVAYNGSATDTLIMIYTLFAAALIFISIMLPLEYVFCEEQARFLLVPAAIISMTAFYVLRQLFGLQSMKWVFITPLILVIFIILSFMASYAIYRRKEFC